MSKAIATPRKTTVKSIIGAVARATEIAPSDLVGKDKHEPLTDARFAAYLMARSRGRTFPEIARVVGRDHSTIISGVQAAGKLIADGTERGASIVAIIAVAVAILEADETARKAAEAAEVAAADAATIEAAGTLQPSPPTASTAEASPRIIQGKTVRASRAGWINERGEIMVRA